MANGNFAGGTGTEQDPYLIEDAFDLDAIRNDLTAHYKLINDIDLDISPFNEGEGWVPVGTFSGTFDGNGCIIRNLYINRAASNQGLFGQVNGGTIKGVGVVDVNMAGAGEVGGLVGLLNSYSTIAYSYSTGSVKGTGYRTGGLVGQAQYSATIANSYSRASVDGAGKAGGLVGETISAIITNSYFSGSLIKRVETGGLVGDSYNLVISNSFWDIETSGLSTSAGGRGLTTQEMQTAQTFIDAGWDAEVTDEGTPIWILQDGKYPILWYEIKLKLNLKLSDVIYSDSVHLQGTIESSSLTRYRINGGEWTSYLEPPASIDTILDLGWGEHTIAIDMENQDGLAETWTKTVTLLSKKPSIYNVSISREYTVNDPINITASVDDKDGNRVKYRTLINGVARGEWSDLNVVPFQVETTIMTTELMYGQNTITIEAQDEIGAVEAYEIVVFRKSLESTYISSTEPTTNFYNSKTLKISPAKITLIKNLYDTKLGYIKSATLRLKVNNMPDTATVKVINILSEWDSQTVTNSTAPNLDLETAGEVAVTTGDFIELDTTKTGEYGVALMTSDGEIEVDYIGNTIEVEYQASKLIRPKNVYGNRVLIEWEPIILSKHRAYLKTVLRRSTSPDMTGAVEVFSTEDIETLSFLDTTISKNTYYYQLEVYLDSQAYQGLNLDFDYVDNTQFDYSPEELVFYEGQVMIKVPDVLAVDFTAENATLSAGLVVEEGMVKSNTTEIETMAWSVRDISKLPEITGITVSQATKGTYVKEIEFGSARVYEIPLDIRGTHLLQVR